MKDNHKNEKIFKILLIVCIGIFCCSFLITGMPVYAAMSDEAEDYELQTTFKGHIDGYDGRYYKFTISDKSYVSIACTCKILSGTNKLTFQIYSSSGKVVLRRDDVIEKYNAATETYTGSNGRILNKGTYYLFVYSGDDKFNWYTNANYTFTIQAEKHISLSKGAISSLKSKKKGQMTIKCKSASNAIGYRIQYALNEKFTKNRKTIYVADTTKTVKGLKKGQRYYVKVCPYTVYDDGTRVFGQNSLVKTVVIKR